ncbi:poly-beta-1,6-N-acetyl-D-glucosamine N-deacetylase PgaB [Luteimonas sp. 100069]|uniref:poly-beta-1,6-N-acetyl-D-glucosamine N-deacetylase PgaB n=1 Tax=Luteimonas sp. 100069 TaxID=2006109 RepID=UPI000F511AA4|nr:poly-beta-1,6-N-acetyl-D-glucosamine N-deacetylase PgaB [Luteimonas sp. 100069]RPD85952.1 poly-beta-1,6-N-acetyl-D-glucosamine N-deacetylase PgaB [Luteimonas sp. 100069]
MSSARGWLAAGLLALLSALSPSRASLLVLSYHDIRDDVAPKGDPDPYAVSTTNFAQHLDWLRAHGYQAVSVQAVIDARAGRGTLPDKAVLLTFDDGLRSVYTHAFPLLRAYNWPALVAPVTSWVELPADQRVPYGPSDLTTEDFLTWAQLRQMHDSGLVEIGSHSHDLHRGVPGNPFGNQTPAAVTRVWSERHVYESDAAWRARIEADLQTSRALIERNIGQAPRVIVWPYAAYNDPANGIATALGMSLSFDLEGRAQQADLGLQGEDSADQASLASLARLLIHGNPDVRDLAGELRRDLSLDGMRAIQVDLDYVYDEDPAQLARNVDVLVQRIHDIGPSHVWLQAFADPDGDGAAEAVYFPSRHMPMRADLFNRVAWQLRTRAQVRVYAWMPVLGFKLADTDLQRELQIAATGDNEIPRLDPGDPRTLEIVSDIYAELATSSHFDGLLFHDDAYLRDDEIPAYGDGIPAARTQALIDFTMRLRTAAERGRPKLMTARNLFARPVLEPVSEAWFAQRLEPFLAAYDVTALMAMPQMENAGGAHAWLHTLAAAVLRVPGGAERTLFELQTVDWRGPAPLPGAALRAQSRMLQALGVRHLGYYPDDFIGEQPPLEDARDAMSARAFPYLER